VATKQDYFNELTDLLDLPRVKVFNGSSLDSSVFREAAKRTDVSTAGGMPNIAERIIRKAGRPWAPSFDSRKSPSGGGSTVTRVGLGALVEAMRILLGAESPRDGFLLTWNPTNWHWPDEEIADDIQATAAGQIVLGEWSTGARSGGIQVGDRLFLLKQAAEPRGVIASGTARGVIYQDAHWDGSGREANYVDVDWDRVIDPEDPLRVDLLKAKIPGLSWRPQGSGTVIPAGALDRLEELWAAHTGRTRAGATPAGGQGRLLDAERRKKVEDAAQERLMAHYEALGYDVEDTHIGNPFDARATRDGVTVYLEAKGTSRAGETVMVTRGEVKHALANPGHCFMGILSGVRFNSSGEVEAGSGDLRIVPFKPKEAQLNPIAYDWTVPTGQVHP